MEKIQPEEDKPFDAPQLTGRLLQLSDNPIAFTFCLREALRCAWEGGCHEGHNARDERREVNRNPYDL